MDMQFKVTRQALHDHLSNLITGLTTPTATDCQLTSVQLSLVVLQIVSVLRVQLVDLADGADPEADVIAIAVAGKALTATA